jgi:hypothetical protein
MRTRRVTLLTTVITLAAAGLAGACSSARPWVPAGSEGMEPVTVERQGRFGRLDMLRFGDWSTDSARASWGRGGGGALSVGGVGPVTERGTQPYAFLLLHAGEPRLRAGCVGSVSTEGVAIRSVEIPVGQDITLDCSFEDAAGVRRGELSLAGRGLHVLRGTLHAGDSRFSVEPEPAGSALRRDVRGFWIRLGDELVAVADVRGDVLWLAERPLDPAVLDVIAAAAAALLVFRPPV